MLSSTPRFLTPRRLHRKTRLVTGHPSTLARDLKNDEDDNNRKASGQFAGSWPLSSWDSACHPGVIWRTPLVRNPFRLASAQDLGILNNAYPTQDPGPSTRVRMYIRAYVRTHKAAFKPSEDSPPWGLEPGAWGLNPGA